MAYKTSFQEITDLDNPRKKAYVRYINKIVTDKKDWGKMTEKQFIKAYCDGSYGKFRGFKKWELTEEYQLIKNKLMFESINKDLLEVYEVVRAKAIEGDDKAIKTLFMLKKEIENNIKNIETKNESIESNQEEFDSLEI